MRLQNFRKALESIDDVARGAFRSNKKNKEKNQTINPRPSGRSAEELSKDSRFEKIEAIHDDASGLIEEGLTFPRQGSMRAIQRREEIIKKINEKKKVNQTPIEMETVETTQQESQVQQSPSEIPKEIPEVIADKSEEGVHAESHAENTQTEKVGSKSHETMITSPFWLWVKRFFRKKRLPRQAKLT